MNFNRSIFVCGVTALAVAAYSCHAEAATVFSHSGSADPVTEGFSAIQIQPPASTRVGVTNDLGFSSWTMTGTGQHSQFGYVSGSPSSAVKTALATSGFQVSATFRTIQGLAPAFDTITYTHIAGLEYDDGTVRWEMDAGVNAAGNTVITLPTVDSTYGAGAVSGPGAFYVIPGATSAYHTYMLSYSPNTATASLFVDGVDRLDGYTGETAFVSNSGLEFTVVSGGGGNFAAVSLAGVPEPTSLALLALSTPWLANSRSRMFRRRHA